MNTMPVLLALAGVALLVWEIRSFVFLRRALQAGTLLPLWRRRRGAAFLLGALLAITVPWQQYPLGGGTAADIPFFAAWYDAKGRDFTGAVTLPALVGNGAVWFLAPQLVLASLARRASKSREGSRTGTAQSRCGR